MTMATTAFDNLAHELEGKFGVGAAAQPLMRELLELMSSKGGGVAGFLDRFRSAGLGGEIASFVGGGSGAPLSAKSVDSALGEGTVAGIAQRVGLKPNVASTALGFEIPKVIGLLTPGGKVPTELPNEFQSFLKSRDQVRPDAVIRSSETARPDSIGTTRMGGPTGAAVQARRGGNLWIWPVLGLIVLAALLYWALSPKTVSQPGAPAAAIDTLNRTLNATVLNFAPGSAELPTASGPAMQLAAGQIKNLPAGTAIEIAGYTDNAGEANANLALSQQRADAVRNVLVQDGVNPAMLTAKGYGDANPIASNDTADGRQRNNRVVFNAAGATRP